MKKLAIILMTLTLTLGLAITVAQSIALPPFTNPFTEEESLERAVTNYMMETDFGFTPEEGGVLIPTPIILKTEVNADETEATVYGNFWIFTYTLDGKIMKTGACGENPGVMKLKKNDGKWNVTSLELAEEGDGFDASIKKFANGDAALEADYFRSSGAAEDSFLPQFQRAAVLNYVQMNNLDVEAYQDYGEKPVSIID